MLVCVSQVHSAMRVFVSTKIVFKNYLSFCNSAVFFTVFVVSFGPFWLYEEYDYRVSKKSRFSH